MVSYAVFWGTALACVAADLLSKSLVFGWIGEYSKTHDVHTVVRGFFTMRGVMNTGGIWGIGKDFTLVFAVVRLIALFVILYLVRVSRRPRAFLHFGLGLVFGGAVGNLWDTLIHGAVRDFLEFDLHVMVWPTFNLADSFITIGAVLLMVHFFGGRGRVEGDKAGIEAL